MTRHGADPPPAAGGANTTADLQLHLLLQKEEEEAPCSSSAAVTDTETCTVRTSAVRLVSRTALQDQTGINQHTLGTDN